MDNRRRLALPSGATLSGQRRDRGHMFVGNAGKPPKLRWRPGSFIRIGGKLYEIMYCYRLKEDPTEWRFSCEERQTLSSEPTDLIGQMAKVFGCGETTPRIVYELFRDGMSAISFFMDIPINANRSIFTNKMMLQNAELVSSGEVITDSQNNKMVKR